MKAGLKNGLKKRIQNVARIKHGFVELVVILFTLSLILIMLMTYRVIDSLLDLQLLHNQDIQQRGIV